MLLELMHVILVVVLARSACAIVSSEEPSQRYSLNALLHGKLGAIGNWEHGAVMLPFPFRLLLFSLGFC